MAAYINESQSDGEIIPPRFNRKRHYVSLIKMLDPARFLVRETPGPNMSKSAKEFLKLEELILNRADEFDMVPERILLPSKGMLVLVKPKYGKLWQRGRVEMLLESSKGPIVNVYLVDYGEITSVQPKRIRIPDAKTFEIPFQAFEFVLFSVKPLSLKIKDDLSVSRMASDDWDSSAYDFVENFFQDSTTFQIDVCMIDEHDRFHGSLFSNNIEDLCLNEELISNQYAWFDKELVSSTHLTQENPNLPNLKGNLTTHSSRSSSSGAGLGRGRLLKKYSQSKQGSDDGASSDDVLSRSVSQCSIITTENEADDRYKTVLKKYDQFSTSQDHPQPPKEIPKSHLDTFSLARDTGVGRGRGVLNFFTNVPQTMPKGKKQSQNSEDMNIEKSTKSTELDMTECVRLLRAVRRSSAGSTRPTSQNSNCDSEDIKINTAPADSDTRSQCSSRFSSVMTQRYLDLSKKVHSFDMNEKETRARCEKYLQLQKKVPTKESVSNAGSSDFVLKPLPPHFVNQVTTGSEASNTSNEKDIEIEVAKGYDTSLRNTKIGIQYNFDASKIRQKNVNMEVEKEIETAGVDSFFHTKEAAPKQKFNKFGSVLKDEIINVICYGNNLIKPVCKIEDLEFENEVIRFMEFNDIKTPSSLQMYLWSAVLRGRSCVAIGLKNSGKSLGYVLPILNLLQIPSNYSQLPDGAGPIVIVLCSTWLICQKVQEQFESFCSKNQRRTITTVDAGDKIEDKMLDLLNGYHILITTPSILVNLFKMIDMGIDIMDRCCHLILEDGDVLIEIYMDNLIQINREFRNAITRRGRNAETANQIVLCSPHWSLGVKSFAKMMPNPLLYFSNFLEAAIHAELKFYTQICKRSKEPAVILDILEKTSKLNVVICATNYELVQSLSEILKMNSYECLSAHENLAVYEVQTVRQQWQASTNSLNHPILVVSDAILQLLCISNAECLIHYDLPEISKLQFSNRFSCLRDMLVYRGNNLNSLKSLKDESVTQLVINDKCVKQCYELQRILRRLKIDVSPSLAKMARDELMTREMCNHVLAFGKCVVRKFCRYRHSVFSNLDQPCKGIPHYGEVKILVTHVVNAAHYYGNVLQYQDPITGETVSDYRDTFMNMNLKFQEHFRCSKIKEIVPNPMVGDDYAMRGVGGTYFRVKVVKVNPVKLGIVNKAKVFSLDAGWTRTVEFSSLFLLPSSFGSIPPNAVQIRVCKVKPNDDSSLWTVQANTFVSDMILGKQLQGTVVKSIRDTIFIKNFGQRTNLNDESPKSFFVVAKLKSEQMALPNPEHLTLLESLCKDVISWKIAPEVINKFNSPPLAVNEFFDLNTSNEVFVTSVDSPSLFYVVPCKSYERLTELNDTINEMYIQGKFSQASNIRKNSLVIAPLESEQRWYRARVTEVNDSFVQLFFPDFGDQGFAVFRDVYEIPASILQALPFQAVECSMSGIKAAHGGWSERAIDSFTDLTREDDDDSVYRMLILKAMTESPAVNTSSDTHYSVSLFIKNGKSLGLKLIEQGLAEDVNETKQAKTAVNNNNSDSDGLDEDYYRLQKEIDNNHTMLLNGIPQELIEEYRGYKLSGKESTNLKAIENGDETNPNNEEVAIRNDPWINLTGDNGSKIPKTTWFQNQEFVIVQLEIDQCSEDNFSAEIDADFIKFETIKNSFQYNFSEDLFAKIDPGNSDITILPLIVKFVLKKVESGVHWPRLIQSTSKKNHIKLHFDHLDDNDESLNENNSTEIIVPKKTYPYIRHIDITSSEDDDDDDVVIEEED